MHPAILSRYMLNILYNVMIRLINYERYTTNDDEYPKLTDSMRGATLKVSNHSTLSSSKKSHNISLHINVLDSNLDKNYTLLHPSSQKHNYHTNPMFMTPFLYFYRLLK